MSYGPTEFAQHKILGRFTENEELKRKLQEFREPEYPEDARALGIDVKRRQWQPRYVVAIDGSHHEVQYDQGFPGAELGFVSVATILIDVRLLQAESERPSIDPVKFNKVQSTHPFTAVLASTNMITKELRMHAPHFVTTGLSCLRKLGRPTMRNLFLRHTKYYLHIDNRMLTSIVH